MGLKQELTTSAG